MINQYTLHETIGRGGTAKVKLGIKSILGNEKKFAIKIIKKVLFKRQSIFSTGSCFTFNIRTRQIRSLGTFQKRNRALQKNRTPKHHQTL